MNTREIIHYATEVGICLCIAVAIYIGMSWLFGGWA